MDTVVLFSVNTMFCSHTVFGEEQYPDMDRDGQYIITDKAKGYSFICTKLCF